MKTLFRCAIALVISGVIFCNILLSQISTMEKPISFSINNLKYDTKLIKTMSDIDIIKLQKEDEENEKIGVPYFRFGHSHKVDFNLENSGQWFNLPNGDRLWQLKIVSPGAISTNLTYDKFWIPDGAKFFVYSNDKKQSIGAITAANTGFTEDNMPGFATALLYSDSITLEYYLPKHVNDKGIICIDSVVHGYKDAFQNTRGIICAFNINCPEGSDWQTEKRAVAMIVIGSASYGTGSLINNTKNDFRPLFLTAKHVYNSSATVFSNWMFYWKAEAVCDDNLDMNNNYTTTGATLLAQHDTTDFRLLELIQHPANITIGYTPYYLGWDKTGNTGINPVCIHHPGRYYKSISISIGTPTTATCMTMFYNGVQYYTNNFWKSVWDGKSTTHSGSSGAALINSNRKVIGQLFGHDPCAGGLPPCPDWMTNKEYSTFGKLSRSWTGGGTNTTRLSDWLDPAPGTGETVLDGIDDCWTISVTGTQTETVKRVICRTVNVQNATVPAGKTLDLKATDRVIINPGFTVQSGATFIIR